MVEREPGYARPEQHGVISDAAEQAIETACPGAVVAKWGSAPKVDPYWGPLRGVGVGHAVDEAVRYEGSSGGAISALLIHALETGVVDRVVHVEADPANPTRNIMRCSRSRDDVLLGAGSRYTASSPLAQLDEVLAIGGKVAFVGKPCDVSALRRLAEVDERIGRHVPIMLSFFCGGMPSHAGVRRILNAMDVSPEEVVSFRFRGRGWPGTAAAVTRDGRTAEMSYAESWGDFLAKEVQFRCKICPDAVGGVADIACADAWYGGETGYPTFVEQDGRSLIVSRTSAGEALLKGAIDQRAVVFEPLEPAEIHLMQPSQARRKRLIRSRVAALAALGQPRPVMSGVLVAEAARDVGLREAVENFVGALRRVLLRRR